MTLPRRKARRGQPLVALALLLVGWVGVRTVLWASSDGSSEKGIREGAGQAIAPRPPVQPDAAVRPDAFGPQSEPLRPAGEPLRRPTTIVPLVAPGSSDPRPRTEVSPRIAAGHQLLLLAGASAFPASPQERAAGSLPPPMSPSALPLAGRAKPLSRWSADGWVMWRQGGNGYNLPGRGLPGAILYSGAYGASQAGLVLRYRLAADNEHRPALYVRASSGQDHPRGEELAAGLALRPLTKVPVAVMGEVRATRTIAATLVRPAAAVVTELPVQHLPLGLRAEVYAQAGWVGGKGQTAFLDGQVRIDRRVGGFGGAELHAGAGAWGGAQQGASRLDIGPSLRLDLPIAGANTRLGADYRIRAAGSAAPGNGVAITFSAGF